MGKAENSVEPTGKASLELEEYLTLSQKILRREIGDNANDSGGQQMEMDDDGHGEQNCRHRQDGRASSCGAIKDAASTLLMLATCSSTASPPSRACFPLSLSSSSYLHAERPRYFPQSFAAEWSPLEGSGLEKTVFGTFSSSIELIEKFDLTLFESLLEQQNLGGSLLTPAQRARVSDVRHRLGLQSFEIQYAIHRLDPNVLTAEQVHLVEEIAPTKADIRRFALFKQFNSAGTLSEDEEFVLELSKIDRLEEKLAVLALLGEFDVHVAEINQRLQNFAAAAKLLFNSAQFHTLFQLLLTSINLVGGDFNGGPNLLVKGFHPSSIGDMCSLRFPGGKTLLEVLASILRKDFPDLLAFVGNNGGIVGEAAKFDFAQILRALHSLEKGQSLVEEELQQLAGHNGRNQQQLLASFLAHCSVECAQLREAVQSTKSQLLATMEYFGDICGSNKEGGQEANNNFQPERFFAVIAQFFGDIHTTMTSQ